MHSLVTRSLLVVTLSWCGGQAFAGLATTYYGISGSALQTGDSIVGASSYYAQVTLRYETSGEVDASRLTLPNGDSFTDNGYGPNNRVFSRSFSSETSLNDTFAPGAYRLGVTSGSLAGLSADFNVPAGLMPVVVPQLTGDSYTRLQGMNTGAPLTITTSAFTDRSYGSNCSFQVSDRVTGETRSVTTIFSGTLDTVTIPANFLVPFREYFFFLSEYNPDYGVVTTPMGTTPLNLSGNRDTRGRFVTGVPEPSSVVALILGAVALVRRRRSRTA